MSVASWGELAPTLEDVLNLKALLLYVELNTMSVLFKEEDEDNFQRPIASMDHSKDPSSSSMHKLHGYATLARVRGL